MSEICSDHNDSVPLNNQRDISHHSLSANQLLGSQNKVLLSRQNSISSHRGDGLSRQNSIRTPRPLTPQSSVGSNSLDEYKRNNLTSANGTNDLDQKEKTSEKAEKENGANNGADVGKLDDEDDDIVRSCLII